MTKNTNIDSALAILTPEVVSQLRAKIREEVRNELVSRLSDDGAVATAPKRRKAKAKPETKQAKSNGKKPSGEEKSEKASAKASEEEKTASSNRIKTTDGRSASQFIRDLDDSEGELPAAEVVARAQKEHGIEIKASLVNNVRTNRRKASGEPRRKPGRKPAVVAAEEESEEESEE